VKGFFDFKVLQFEGNFGLYGSLFVRERELFDSRNQECLLLGIF